MSQDKKAVAADDLYELQIVSDPQISPDGKQVLFCVQRVDRATEKKYTNLWIVAADEAAPRQFTYGDHADTSPRWSPDGRQIAFLSNRHNEEQPQIYLLPLAGGEARQLSDLQGSFGSLEWSPDGQHLVCQFRKKDEEVLEREADEQKKKLGIVARRITTLNYKLDGVGYLPAEKWHVWVIDTTSGEATQVTDGPYDELNPRWSPDGRRILFTSNRSENPDLDLDAVGLYLVPSDGGELQEIETRYGRKSLASFSPDGNWVAYLGPEQPGHFYQNSNLYLVPVDGGESRNVTAQEDLHLGMATLTDTGSGSSQTPPTWSTDGSTIYVQASIRGRQPLLAINVQTGAYDIVADAPGTVGSFSMDRDRKQASYLWGSLDMVGQVWLCNLAKDESRQLTSFNQQLFDSWERGQIEEVCFEGPNGQELHGWILKPPGFEPESKYPSILEIHGGPMSQYGYIFMHEFHFLAAQGYVVYWSNPRGSQGYGEAFAGAISNRWGTVDYDDVMAWTDYVATQPYIDRDRMGVTGGSYGGYMTTLIVGRTHRFRAAVAQRVVSNFISFYGSSDMNWLTEALCGSETPPWVDVENYWRQSPLRYIGNAQTPTMVIHSENDYRCDREQGEQVFVALKRLGVESELILFPDESHGLSRGGRTDRRVARLEHMQRWFERFLS